MVQDDSPKSTTSKVSKTSKRSSRSKTKSKATAIQQAKHNAKTKNGDPITLTREKIESMKPEIQLQTFGYVVFIPNYDRHIGKNKQEFLEDDNGYDNSYNAYDNSYLKQKTKSKQRKQGVKRGRSSKLIKKSKKAKTSHSKSTAASLDMFSTATGGTTTTNNTEFKKWSCPVKTGAITVRIYVPPLTFSRTAFSFYQLPKFLRLRLGKKTHIFRWRTLIGAGKPIYLSTIDTIKTPYGGDLNFHFTVNNCSSQIHYPDDKEWKTESQGTTKGSQISFCGCTHRTVVNLELHYRATGDSECSSYVSYLKSIGLRPLAYYIAYIKYWCLDAYQVTLADKSDPNFNIFNKKDWLDYTANLLRSLDKQLLIQCCLNPKFMCNYDPNEKIDKNFKILVMMSSHCPIAGTHGGYKVADNYISKVSEIDKLKHFGFTKLGIFWFFCVLFFCIYKFLSEIS